MRLRTGKAPGEIYHDAAGARAAWRQCRSATPALGAEPDRHLAALFARASTTASRLRRRPALRALPGLGPRRGPTRCCTSSADGARACINIPLDSNKGGKRAIYADYLRIFQAVGWTYQTSIVWNEQNISRRTAWGSWLSPSAPFVTAPVEMIAVFYKGTFRRPPTDGRRGDITRDEFLAWTLGMWTFAGANPRRVGHPAPFPEELPRRLIKLYSYPNDLVLDPFAGSGTTLVAARKLGSTLARSGDQSSVLRAGEAEPAHGRARRRELS